MAAEIDVKHVATTAVVAARKSILLANEEESFVTFIRCTHNSTP